MLPEPEAPELSYQLQSASSITLIRSYLLSIEPSINICGGLEAYAKPRSMRFMPPIYRNLKKIGDTPH